MLIENKQPITQIERIHFQILVIYPQLGNQCAREKPGNVKEFCIRLVKSGKASKRLWKVREVYFFRGIFDGWRQLGDRYAIKETL